MNPLRVAHASESPQWPHPPQCFSDSRERAEPQQTNTESLLGVGTERFWDEPIKTFVYKETPQGLLFMFPYLFMLYYS